MRVITGKARGAVLKSLEGMETRPTAAKTKEAIFSIVQFNIEGRKVLDLFAGTGQMGIEALSRGAAHAVFVDNNRKAAEIIRANLEKTRLTDGADVRVSDYKAFLQSQNGQQYGLIFIDPPYAAAEMHIEKCLKWINSFDILADGGIIVCESGGLSAPIEGMGGICLKKEYAYGRAKVCIYTKQLTGSSAN